MPIISLSNIGVQFEGITALKDISFAIEKGEYVGLIGPNGAGKSTLLQVILGTLTPSSGNISITTGTSFGYVPQNYFLNTSFSISVAEVIQMASASPFFWQKKSLKKQIENVIEMVGLTKKFLKKNFQDLSGGQKQRVIIARSLLQNPDVLLFDEPLSGVDFETKLQVHELLAMLNEKYNTTIIFVSHEIESIISKCHRIVCLNKTIHKGCHPMQFAEGKIESCKIPKTKKIISPIHHHHSLTEKL